MSSIQSPSPPHQYPQEIQLKLYQAFIFSIPILFSIILFLLFYLFYLKRRALAFSSTPPILPTTINDANTVSTLDSDLKNELNNKLCTIVFDEHMEARDLLCCVCLGEFEEKEELVEVASCKHIFHEDCIRHWLHNNSTCPLCRALILSSHHNQPKYIYSHHHHTHPPPPPSNHHQVVVAPQQQQPQLQHCVRSEGSSSSSGGDDNIC